LGLIPADTDKLSAQWQGPYMYVVTRDTVSYEVDMTDKKKRIEEAVSICNDSGILQ
jgi:hypothetical protein